jgi:hypothetical protein
MLELVRGKQYQQFIISDGLYKEHRDSIKNIFCNYGKIITDELKFVLTNGSRSGKMYMYKGVPIQASAHGEPPAMRSGRLARSNKYRVEENELHIMNTAGYSGYLEEGTIKMQARGFFLPIISNHNGNIQTDLSSLKK